MKITQANVYENSFNARRTTACGMFFTRDIIETKMGVHEHVSPSFQQQSIGMCHEFNQCILHTYSKVPGQKFGEIEDNIDDFESVEEFFRNIFLSVRLLSFLCGHSVFASSPQRPMTSDFEGFSIPDFIHYIFFPS